MIFAAYTNFNHSVRPTYHSAIQVYIFACRALYYLQHSIIKALTMSPTKQRQQYTNSFSPPLQSKQGKDLHVEKETSRPAKQAWEG